jgi:hypothetical protein
MTRPLRMFARTDMATECDACQRRFDVVSGGVCVRCKRLLCSQHLHGSWSRRLMVDFGAAPICSDCRRDGA